MAWLIQLNILASAYYLVSIALGSHQRYHSFQDVRLGRSPSGYYELTAEDDGTIGAQVYMDGSKDPWILPYHVASSR